MAARTGASVGVAVTITVLGLLAVGLFVTTMVFYGQAQRNKSDLQSAREQYADFVSDAQREHASVRAVLDEARQARHSVVEHLMLSRAELLKSATGDQSMTMATYRERLGAVEGAEGMPLMDLVAAKNATIAQLTQRAETAEAARQAAQDQAQAEAARVAKIESAFAARGDSLKSDVGTAVDMVAQTDAKFKDIEARYATNLESLEADLQGQLTDKQTRIDELNSQNIALQDQVLRLRGEGRNDRVTPRNEEALVDGRVDRVDIGSNEVILSIGRANKVVLGMTFAIYSNATDIRPDEHGVYPQGKAAVEVVRVEDGFSRARILRSSEGNPIIRGDVVANAAYDPNKTYKFVVDGLFDTNGDGRATRYERDELAALIERWGGKVVNEVTGDLDFVVLGAKPVLPPAPAPGAPIAVINEYNRLNREIQRYDELMQSAEASSIPLLNANRLQTLIGAFPN